MMYGAATTPNMNQTRLENIFFGISLQTFSSRADSYEGLTVRITTNKGETIAEGSVTLNGDEIQIVDQNGCILELNPESNFVVLEATENTTPKRGVNTFFDPNFNYPSQTPSNKKHEALNALKSAISASRLRPLRDSQAIREVFDYDFFGLRIQPKSFDESIRIAVPRYHIEKKIDAGALLDMGEEIGVFHLPPSNKQSEALSIGLALSSFLQTLNTYDFEYDSSSDSRKLNINWETAYLEPQTSKAYIQSIHPTLQETMLRVCNELSCEISCLELFAGNTGGFVRSTINNLGARCKSYITVDSKPMKNETHMPEIDDRHEHIVTNLSTTNVLKNLEFEHPLNICIVSGGLQHGVVTRKTALSLLTEIYEQLEVGGYFISSGLTPSCFNSDDLVDIGFSVLMTCRTGVCEFNPRLGNLFIKTVPNSSASEVLQLYVARK